MEPTLNLDMDTLTLNEVEALEEATGRSIDSLMDEGKPKGKVLKGLVWIIARRANPDLTLDEAGEMPLSDVMELLGAVDADEEGND